MNKANGPGRYWWLVIALVYCAPALIDPGLPGLYMDAVNPDYLAVWLRSPAGHIPAWIYLDNLLLPGYRFPLLNSLYGGATTAYVYLGWGALFGYGLVSVRLLHAAYGLLMVLALGWLVKRFSGSALLALAAGCALAIEPALLFAWRTQYYLQLFPMLLFAPGLVVMLTSGCSNVRYARWAILAGVLMGFAAFCYFTYAFFAIAALSAQLLFVERGTRARRVAAFTCGFLIGWSPYLFAHLSILVQIGFDAYMDTLKGLQGAYGVMDGQAQSMRERLQSALLHVLSLPGGESIDKAIHPGTTRAASGLLQGISVLFALGLLSGSVAAAHGLKNNADTPAVRFLTAASFIAIAQLLFGTAVGRPLGFQHYVAFLPVGVALGAVSIYYWASRAGPPSRSRQTVSLRSPAGVAGLAVFLIYFTASALMLASQFDRLRETGGTGNYSDAINRLGEYARDLPTDTWLLFPQWGYWMGVTIITDGSHRIVEATSVEDLKRKLANERPNRLALVIRPDMETGAVGALTDTGDYRQVSRTGFAERNGTENVAAVLFVRSEAGPSN